MAMPAYELRDINGDVERAAPLVWEVGGPPVGAHAEAPAVVATDTTGHGEERRARVGYVLVVDDDPAIVALLLALLRDDEGFLVRAATSVEAALRVAGSATALVDGAVAEAPALLLLDVSLLGERVEEAIQRLRMAPGWERTPIALCSGSEHLAATARQVGATAFLRKPFQLDAIVELAETFVRRVDAEGQD